MRRVALATALLLIAAAPVAAAQSRTQQAAQRPELRLAAQQVEPAAQSAGRFRLRARFAPAESAGELREAKDLHLIGRFAKAGASCDASFVFRNGFEGN